MFLCEDAANKFAIFCLNVVMLWPMHRALALFGSQIAIGKYVDDVTLVAEGVGQHLPSKAHCRGDLAVAMGAALGCVGAAHVWGEIPAQALLFVVDRGHLQRPGGFPR